jgi:hypothetical protein
VELLVPDERYAAVGPIMYNWITGRVSPFEPLWGPIFAWLRGRRAFTMPELAA